MDADPNELPGAVPVATTDLPSESPIFAYILDLLFVVQSWWIESDFQIKLLIILLSCLALNLILIRAAWKIYGDRLSEMLMKDSTGQDLYEDGTRIQTEDLLNTKFPRSEKMHRD